MNLEWNEHPEAREEFLAAHARYLEIEDGSLADQFVDVLESAIQLILDWPDAPPPYSGRRRNPMIRTWHVGKFPYNIIHTVREGEIVVIAYARESRRPGYWVHRLSD